MQLAENPDETRGVFCRNYAIVIAEHRKAKERNQAMGKHFRIVIAFIVILSLVLLARNKAAGASDPALGADPSSAGQAELSAFLATPKDCPKGLDNDFGKRSTDKCNDRDSNNDLEDDNGEADDEDDDNGTVKPPSQSLLIPVTGDYSVGGFCTLSVELKDTDIQLDATLEAPLPGELPEGVGQVREGCLLTYYRSDRLILGLPQDSGNTTICYAAIPSQETVVYFYDLYAAAPAWAPLATAVEGGTACAPANASGVYIASYQQ